MLSTMIGRHPNILGVRTETIMTIRDWYVEQGVKASKVRNRVLASLSSTID